MNPCEATALLKPSDPEYKRFGQPDQPVVLVSWFEANAFCHWLTRKLGGNKWIFALPTVAEWEKVARGPDNFDYGLGITISDEQSRLYNWKKNPTAPVTLVGIRDSRAAYKPNRYGVYHMSGSVTEWTLSSACIRANTLTLMMTVMLKTRPVPVLHAVIPGTAPASPCWERHFATRFRPSTPQMTSVLVFRRDNVAELRENGVSWREIARRTGVSVRTVRRVLAAEPARPGVAKTFSASPGLGGVE